MVKHGLERLRLMNLISAACTPHPRTAFGKVAALESGLYMRNQLLRDSDWAGMAHSLEIRVPLVDSQLLRQVSFGSRFAGAGSKDVLAAAPSMPIPGEIFGRAKTGFCTPISSWMTHAVAAFPGRRAISQDAHWSRGWCNEVYAAVGG
jgi:asparagine synthase (glutamine-hydrolysing)